MNCIHLVFDGLIKGDSNEKRNERFEHLYLQRVRKQVNIYSENGRICLP